MVKLIYRVSSLSGQYHWSLHILFRTAQGSISVAAVSICMSHNLHIIYLNVFQLISYFYPLLLKKVQERFSLMTNT